MKIKVYIAALILAVISLLAMSLTPHHHHSGEFCRIIEVCDTDRVPNDPHTEHGGDQSRCIADDGTLIVTSKGQLQLLKAPLLPLLLSAISPLPSPGDFAVELPPIESEVVSPLYTTILTRNIPHRAPPYPFS